jgi:hypothetical protein
MYLFFLFLSTVNSFKSFIPTGINFLKSYSYNEHNMKYNDFFKKNEVLLTLNHLSQQDLKHPIILSGPKLVYNEDICNIFCNMNDIEFKKYTFDDFMLELPHVNNKNCLLFIEDFLIKNGRILNEYEEYILLELNENSNLIVFNSNELEKVPFKDTNIIRRFKNIKLKAFTKKDMIFYINYIIYINNYDDNLYLIDWKTYNFENLNFEKINMILFEVDSLFKENNSINNILYSIDLMLRNL